MHDARSRASRVTCELAAVRSRYGVGYSYLALVRPLSRDFVARLLGSFPLLVKLFRLDSSLFSLDISLGLSVAVGARSVSLAVQSATTDGSWMQLAASAAKYNSVYVPIVWKSIPVVPRARIVNLDTLCVGDFEPVRSCHYLYLDDASSRSVDVCAAPWVHEQSQNRRVALLSSSHVGECRVSFVFPDMGCSVYADVSAEAAMTGPGGRTEVGLVYFEPGGSYACTVASRVSFALYSDLDVRLPTVLDQSICSYHDGDRFLDGYTYLHLIQPQARFTVAKLLGSFPKMRDLLMLPAICALSDDVLDSVYVQTSAAGLAFGTFSGATYAREFSVLDIFATYRERVVRLPEHLVGGRAGGVEVQVEVLSASLPVGKIFDVVVPCALNDVVSETLIIVQAPHLAVSGIVSYSAWLAGARCSYVHTDELQVFLLPDEHEWELLPGIAAVGRFGGTYIYIKGTVIAPPGVVRIASSDVIPPYSVSFVYGFASAKNLQVPSVAVASIDDLKVFEKGRGWIHASKPEACALDSVGGPRVYWIMLREFTLTNNIDARSNILTVYPKYYGVLALSPSVNSNLNALSVCFRASFAEISRLR